MIYTGHAAVFWSISPSLRPLHKIIHCGATLQNSHTISKGGMTMSCTQSLRCTSWTVMEKLQSLVDTSDQTEQCPVLWPVWKVVSDQQDAGYLLTLPIASAYEAVLGLHFRKNLILIVQVKNTFWQISDRQNIGHNNPEQHKADFN